MCINQYVCVGTCVHVRVWLIHFPQFYYTLSNKVAFLSCNKPIFVIVNHTLFIDKCMSLVCNKIVYLFSSALQICPILSNMNINTR